MGAPQYPNTVRAQAISLLLSGVSVHETARRCKVGSSTVSNWKRRAGLSKDMEVVERHVALDVGMLVTRYLEQLFIALTAQAELASNQEWLEKQGAMAIAELHREMSDRAMRILTAIAPTEAQTVPQTLVEYQPPQPPERATPATG